MVVRSRAGLATSKKADFLRGRYVSANWVCASLCADRDGLDTPTDAHGDAVGR